MCRTGWSWRERTYGASNAHGGNSRTDAGESYADIGRAAQMSKQRVGQIIKEARP